MIEIRNKWLGANEARQSIETGDFFRMLDGNSLVITSEAEASAAGKVRFNFLVKETGETGTAYLEGLTRKVKQVVNVGDKSQTTVPAKANNSQAKGENKVLSVTLSTNKKQKRFLKAWRAMLQVHRIYCPEATDIPTAMWDVLNAEDSWFNHIEEVKKQQAIEKARAEEEAKKQAEEEAKKQAEFIQTIKNEQQVLLSFGMSAAQVHTMLEQKYGAEILATVL